MVGERSPEQSAPSLQALELAGALQGVIGDVANRGFRLGLHQEEAFNAIGGGLVNGETVGYIESATGSGKGLLISLLAEAAARAGQRVHILAPTTQIADQLIGADGETGIGRFTDLIGDGAVKQNYGGRRGNDRHLVVVSTYQGFLEETKAAAQGKGRLGEFDLVLGDECHKSLGDLTVSALYRYAPNAVKVGFSATPDYAEDRQSEEIWGKRWFEFSLRTAIEAGKAAPARALLMTTDSTIELSDYRSEFTDRELAPLIDNFERNGLALKLTQDFVGEGRQGIMACVAGRGNAHATIMADLLSNMEVNGRRIVAKAVGTHISRDEQRRYLQAYRNGEIDVLTFTKALEEGWDSDRASFCLNLSPSTSPVRIKQLLGRLARPKPDGLESIFVDFVDEKEGINKTQYTAAHALELEDINLDRVIGWGYQTNNRRPNPQNINTYVRPELYARLMRVQGKSLADALVSKVRNPVDPLVAHWERTLAKEGMPAELPDNIVFTPALAKRYQQAADILRRQTGEEPTSGEVADLLREKGATREQEKVVRELGQRVIIEAEVTASETPARESVEDIVARLMLKKVMSEVLDTLSDREAGILTLRYGVNDEHKDHTLSEVGKIYGLSDNRVRQIEATTLSKMRHQSRAGLLRDYTEVDNGEKDSPPPLYQKDTGGNSIFSGMPGVEVPVYDSRDRRPYIDRIREASENAAQAWLEESTEKLETFIDTKLTSEAFLRAIAKSTVRPYSGQEPETVPTFDLNAARTQALYHQQIGLTHQLNSLLALRRKIEERPLHPQSQASRDATTAVLDARIGAFKDYGDQLHNHIVQYFELADGSERAPL